MKLVELAHDITVFADFPLHQFTQLEKKVEVTKDYTLEPVFQHSSGLGVPARRCHVKKGQTTTKRFHLMQKLVFYSFQFLKI